MAANAVLWYLSAHQPSKVITTGPTASQVQDQLWREIRQWGERLVQEEGWDLPPKAPQLDTDRPDHFAKGISTTDRGRLEGYHSPHLLIVVDEAWRVDDDIYHGLAGLQPEKVLLISTPGPPQGRFYDAFRTEGWVTFHMDGHQVAEEPRERVTWMTIERMKADLGVEEGDALYRQKVRAEFTAYTEHPYFDPGLVDAAVGRALPAGPPHWLGVDWGQRVDFTALVEGRGGCVVRVETTQRPYTEAVGRIRELHRRDPFDLIAADEGEGMAQIDLLREAGLPVRGRRWTRQTKVQDLAELKRALEEGSISLPRHESLLEQLRAFQRLLTAEGNPKLGAPRGMHDDIVTALAMGWAAAARRGGGDRVRVVRW